MSYSKKKIRLIVFGLHFVCLLAIYFSSDSKPIKPTKKLVVHTRTPTPSIATPQVQVSTKKATQASAPKKPPVAKAKAAEPKKPVAPAVKKQVVKKQAKPEAPKNEIPNQLLKELEASLNKIDSVSKNSSPKKKLTVPDSPKELTVDHLTSAFAKQSYQETLVQFLQHNLQLPEHGEVKIALTLKKDGAVIHVQVIKAESDKNRLFLERNLNLIIFPHFPFNEEKTTFVLTFCNQ